MPILADLATKRALLTIALRPALDLPKALLLAVLAVLGSLLRELLRELIHDLRRGLIRNRAAVGAVGDAKPLDAPLAANESPRRKVS